MIRLIVLVLVFALTLLVSACGVRGDLERPPPLWGEDMRSEAERAHENQADGSQDDS